MNATLLPADLESGDGAIATEFAERLERRLRERGAQNVDLARAVGVSKATVGRWLAGEMVPKGHRVRAIAEFFGWREDDLLVITGSRQPTDQERDAITREELAAQIRDMTKKLEEMAREVSRLATQNRDSGTSAAGSGNPGEPDRPSPGSAGPG